MVEQSSDCFEPVSLSPVIKVVSAGCNLRCPYCFYSGHQPEIRKMSEEALDILTENLLAEPVKYIDFIWHGGEPTLMGIDFYQKVLEVQEKYKKPGQVVENSIQTNGTIIDKDWAQFFKENNLRPGLSMDGPAEFHNLTRINAAGRGTFASVMASIVALQETNVPVGAIAVINKHTVLEPEKMFNFVKGMKIPFLMNRCEAVPSDSECIKSLAPSPDEYYQFLTKIFDLWIEEDDPNIKIGPFDDLVKAVFGIAPSCCIYRGQCQRYLTIDSNGDVYPCDEFLNQRYIFGNLVEQSLNQVWSGINFRNYYSGRKEVLTHCVGCEWKPVCNGGCMREWEDKKGSFNPREMDYCSARRQFFQTIRDRIFERGYKPEAKPN